MELAMIDVRVPLPDLAPDTPKSVVVKIPVAILSKKVVPGDELVLYVPAEEKQRDDKKVLAVACEPKAKKTTALIHMLFCIIFSI